MGRHIVIVLIALIATGCMTTEMELTPQPSIPTITATSSSSATASPVPMTSTPQPTATNTSEPLPTPPVLPVVIYSQRGAGGLYGFLPDYQIGSMGLVNPGQSIDEPGSPWQAFSLGFANSHNLIAYVIEDPEPFQTQLWISSIDLNRSVSVWEDTFDWLGKNPSYNDGFRVVWGPGDNSVILTNGNSIVVWSLSLKTAFLWKGECGKVGLTENSTRFSLFCDIQSEDGGRQYGIIEWNGYAYVKPVEDTELQREAETWAFSPDGNRLAIADSTGRSMMIEQNGDWAEIPFTLAPTGPFNAIKWSQDSKLLLIFVEEEQSLHCPNLFDRDYLTCWMIIDSTSFQVVWIPSEPLARHGLMFDTAALSPDNDWLLIGFVNPEQMSNRYSYLVSLSTGEIRPAFDGYLYSAGWILP